MKIHLYSLLAYPLVYLLAAFSYASFDISTWSAEDRAGLVAGTTVILVMVNILIFVCRYISNDPSD